MDEKQAFLLKLKDPELYNVNMAASSILDEFEYISGADIHEFSDDDIMFSIGGLPRDYRLWKLILHISCVDILPLNGIDSRVNQYIDSHLEHVIRREVFNSSHFKVSDYLHEGQHIQVVFRTK